MLPCHARRRRRQNNKRKKTMKTWIENKTKNYYSQTAQQHQIQKRKNVCAHHDRAEKCSLCAYVYATEIQQSRQRFIPCPWLLFRPRHPAASVHSLSVLSQRHTSAPCVRSASSTCKNAMQSSTHNKPHHHHTAYETKVDGHIQMSAYERNMQVNEEKQTQ